MANPSWDTPQDQPLMLANAFQGALEKDFQHEQVKLMEALAAVDPEKVSKGKIAITINVERVKGTQSQFYLNYELKTTFPPQKRGHVCTLGSDGVLQTEAVPEPAPITQLSVLR
ncbi:hypothetical protein H1S01_03195 [Heliobacterium chlorum]|uniref:Uncharacterized protein n=1 Tax=Heliobacterium chlorum TaxID=2698 RepID=A0ABR7T093_HELCL|nr:hypothetical protein [Heliobacterium chlorum]MBC9783517.1 hypothetical protein [Heliobacterium chlorum]